MLIRLSVSLESRRILGPNVITAVNRRSHALASANRGLECDRLALLKNSFREIRGNKPELGRREGNSFMSCDFPFSSNASSLTSGVGSRPSSLYRHINSLRYFLSSPINTPKGSSETSSPWADVFPVTTRLVVEEKPLPFKSRVTFCGVSDMFNATTTPWSLYTRK
jgi:hypothetical protein